ncbi:MAG: ribosome maturation factor RimP [Cetobacterium sp.]|uniref:Ribosome maturation factor RimP n=1 Tax=Cetobacterium ceti TaxID=180163 RepID=A0A1T4JTR2_9FUSO|nr:ribosome maturation factor RimP [Cetobacterium ceti]MCJ8342293.1 ribosome maturation factor RimP [Cetobacterium sp.]SJZ33533.1 ribosome maturation factor RimP [Cetobacterium ceti]
MIIDKRELETTLPKLEKIVVPAVEEFGLSLVDLEFVQEGGYLYVRVYVEKEDGDITLEDCAKLSQKIDEPVDMLIDHKFFLEVSSPGVERPLKKEKDFVRFSGEKIQVSLKRKLNDKKNFTGILEKFENDTVYLNVDSEVVEIPLKEIRKANIVFEFNEF